MGEHSTHRGRPARLAIFLALIAITGLACNLPLVVHVQQRQMEATVNASVLRTLAAAPTLPPVTPLPGVQNTPVVAAPTATQILAPLPELTLDPADDSHWLYRTQPGDTLDAVAARFQTPAGEIVSVQALPEEALLPAGLGLLIPRQGAEAPYPQPLLPDSEIVFSPSSVGFDVAAYLAQTGGYLNTYSEEVDGETLSGAEIITRVAVETSTNPRVLLAAIEHGSGWVLGQPRETSNLAYPIGFYVPEYRGLQKELSLAARMLSQGYFGWRAGTLSELAFGNGSTLRIAPQLNAGTVAVQHLFTKLLLEPGWQRALIDPGTFPALYQQMFGDPWALAEQAGPLLPDGLSQAAMQLPFAPGLRWSFTGGPHTSWGVGSPRGAIDFAPVTGEGRCAVSSAWVQAAASGRIARSSRNVVALDLDGDGLEQTGWVLVYFHVADQERIAAGEIVAEDTPLGHPSCQGGSATGTHVHLARKYNGEWIAADGPLPMVLGGWRTVAGERSYQGFLVNGAKSVSAYPDGRSTSILVRD